MPSAWLWHKPNKLPMSCNDHELRYLQRTPAGAEYVSQINAQEADRRTRSAFRDLVLSIVPPRARLFDFGAGPGIDARFFAELGFRVDAYDVDPRMREFFIEHCRDLMDSGRVSLDGSAYRDFLTHAVAADRSRADLVIANFAPLNLVDDLRELFAKFNALTAARGKVLASVLNPWFVGGMRSRLWWRDAPQLLRHGEVFMPGPQAPHYRRLLRTFRSMSAPHFRLSRIASALPPSAWLRAAGSRYVFLLFEKPA
jgi:SAM-dependent methyltransferase